ncbi:disease resistance protein At4g27190-like [Tasmannia lanceolata]|uniref:disease resistance protein At4g27190-like n=1 Tax=Tasmannia lanceolata TaxID=3420 RepID=UPI004063CA33
MEEDIKASQLHFCGCFPNCYSRFKLSKSSIQKMEEVKELINTRANFPEELAVPNPRPESVQEMPGPSIVDQKAASELLDRLKELVLNDDIRKIGIWGMGGVGKITLVSNLNNMMADGSLAHPFDIIIPVTVSSILDLHGIQLQIAERLKFKEELEKESKGRWIETNVNIRVDTLNNEASWELFSKHVGELPDVGEIKSLAREVAEECKGLPLAIKVVSGSMRGKKRVEQWRKALRGPRTSAPRNIERVEDDIFLLRKMSSYDIGELTV